MRQLLMITFSLLTVFSLQHVCAEETKAKDDQVAAAQPDFEREARLASEIVDGIMDGDAVMLADGDHEFLSIYTEADEPKGTVIILHGRGFHPDWMDAVQPLRVGLVEEGWSTLSLQMPVLEKTAKYYDYEPIFPASHARIEAAIAYAKEQSDKPVVILAHSCGAHMAMSWIREKSDESIDAYIGAGMGATDFKQPMREPFPLASMKVPVLDVYGTDEYPAVLRMAEERLAMITEAGNAQSAQKTVEGANHYFANKGEEATAVVAEWLNNLTFE
jgi:alpha-beta hydrolase superfamily lysophospholipase